MQGATKVGGLLIVFVALLYGGYSVLGQSFFAAKTKTYYAEFADASGVIPGTRVLLAGVRIGDVQQVELVGPSLARIKFSVDEKVAIPQGSTASIPSSLIGFGDTAMLIVPPAKQAPALAEGAILTGSRPNPLDAILPDSKATIKELTATLRATRKLMEDGELKAHIEKLMDTSNQTIAKFGSLAGQTQTLLAQNRNQIDAAVHSAALAMADIQQSTAMVAKLMKEGKLQNESLALLDTLNKTTAKAQDLVADLDKFVTDPKLREPMNATMANVADITHTGTKIAANTEEMTANGAIVSKKAIELADKAGQIEDEARAVLQKLGGFFNKTGQKVPPIHVSMDLTRESKPGHWRTDFEATVPLLDSTVDVGLYDAFEGNKIIAQLSKPFSSSGDYRYGVYASKPGVGVDYRLTPKLGLRGDLFDINDPRFNLRAKYEFRDGVYGWVGVDRIFRQNAPSIGIGVHK